MLLASMLWGKNKRNELFIPESQSDFVSFIPLSIGL